MLKSFQQLDTWKKAHSLTLEIYHLTATFPRDERFGLVSQLRRAAASVPANIAEGFGRRSTKDFIRYLEIASGSLEETRYHLILARDLGYMKPAEFASMTCRCNETGKLLGVLIRSLQRRVAR